MKKTLSIALVAAMTLSAVGMSAFAGTDYNAGKVDPSLDKLYAKVDVSDAGKFEELDRDANGEISYEEALNMNYTELNTPTKTFKGWAATQNSAPSSASTSAEKKGNKDLLTAATGVFYVPAVYEVTTDDSKIKENMAAMGDNGKSLEDKLAELDKQYNADGNNAYNTETKKDIAGRATVTRHLKTEDKEGDGFENYFLHAVKVAGVSDADGEKTWVFDVKMANKNKLYAGKTQRVCLELDGVDGGADLAKFGVTVYHIKDWCKAVKVKNVYTSGNKVYIWVDDFSPYAVSLGDGAASTGAADASNPSTGDFSAVPVALLAAAALGATGFVAYKKRKAE
ncbi:MAG: LPXTG cell wall anchor domain-containing protein [Clostridia bacterium]|nr:LPXTG cell wall anchor domain-containing protein [Clostridia bacterium]